MLLAIRLTLAANPEQPEAYMALPPSCPVITFLVTLKLSQEFMLIANADVVAEYTAVYLLVSLSTFIPAIIIP